MTGELTLTGRVLPVGGLKEKSLAALKVGIKTIIIPKGNEKDLDSMPLPFAVTLTLSGVRTQRGAGYRAAPQAGVLNADKSARF